MPEIEEAEEVDNALKVATKNASSTSSGEETLKEEEDTIVKSPKVEKRLQQVPHFRGQQHRETKAHPVPVVREIERKEKKSKDKKSKEKREEGKKRRSKEKKPEPEPESESEHSSDLSSSDSLSSSPPRRHRRGHQRRDQGRSPRRISHGIRQSN